MNRSRREGVGSVPAADKERHEDPASNEDDESCNEAVVATELVLGHVLLLVGPGGVGTEHYHGALEGEVE